MFCAWSIIYMFNLQPLVPGFGTIYHHMSEMRTYCTVDSAISKDIFVWIMGPRRSVNYFNCTV